MKKKSRKNPFIISENKIKLLRIVVPRKSMGGVGETEALAAGGDGLAPAPAAGAGVEVSVDAADVIHDEPDC